MRCDHLNAVVSQRLTQRIAVIGAIPDQIVRFGFDHVEVEAAPQSSAKTGVVDRAAAKEAILAGGIWQSQNTSSAVQDTKDFQNWACNSASAGGSYGPVSANAIVSACHSSKNYTNYIAEKA
jgi:hypothetical protein